MRRPKRRPKLANVLLLLAVLGVAGLVGRDVFFLAEGYETWLAAATNEGSGWRQQQALWALSKYHYHVPDAAVDRAVDSILTLVHGSSRRIRSDLVCALARLGERYSHPEVVAQALVELEVGASKNTQIIAEDGIRRLRNRGKSATHLVGRAD